MKLLKLFDLTLCLSGFLLFTSQVMAEPDYAREQRWADEILPSLMVGDAVFFKQKNQHEFLGLYAEADSNEIAVIVVHGMGLHPDWGLISTIRQDLNETGYATLSIQMPILASDAFSTMYPPLFPEAVERLQLAVHFLKQKKYKRVVIVSHSIGSRMSRVYMEKNPVDVSAWIALSLTQGDTFAGINVPVLDLYGEEDLAHVLVSVAERKKSLVNPLSQQKVIISADHFFNDQESTLLNEVKPFLVRLNQ